METQSQIRPRPCAEAVQQGQLVMTTPLPKTEAIWNQNRTHFPTPTNKQDRTKTV